jgi:thiol:disulfide interchange protein DsbD
MNTRLRCVLVITLILGVVGSALAQKEQDPPNVDDFSQKLDLNILNKPTLGEKGAAQFDSADPSQLEVTLEPQEGLKTADLVTLKVKVTLGPGWYTYSQNPGFGGRTVIKLSESAGVIPLGEGFVPDHEPELVFDADFGELEKFYEEVTWSRKYRIQPGVSKVSLAGTIDYQTCNQQCVPHNEEFKVSADVEAATVTPALASYSLHGRPSDGDEPGPVSLTFRLMPEDARPGETVKMTVRMRLDKGWHVYAQSQEEGPGGTPAFFDLQSFQGLVAVDEGGFQADQKPEIKETKLAETLTVEQHLFHDEVTWTRTFEVAEDAGQTGFGIQGEFQYQVCTEKKCLPPERFPFALGELSAARPIAELPSASLGFSLDEIEVQEQAGSLWLYLVYAFLGGLILNVMPCVLPVLAIKILSFVKQAGESRARIFQLNVAYTVGVVSVFLCLATLAMSLELSWGGLFQLPEFNLVMACLVFAMGLSLLGVFEIPIPGLAGAGGQREGLGGAFLTGIFATFLATPCTGPFMGATLGWSVRQQPHIIYLVWGMMGVGMAFPYLLAGLFPAVIRWLPKPGNWMVRFKELSGFALMGAVIWIISFTNTYLIVPAMIMMMGLAVGLWMIGNLYDQTTHITHKMTVRVIAVVATGGIVYYGVLQIPDVGYSNSESVAQEPASERDASRSPAGETAGASQPAAAEQQVRNNRVHGEHSLPWQDFSEEALLLALRQKKTVLIDFTADWCLICKQIEKKALNTEKTLALVKEHGIVPLYADFTDRSPYLQGWLKKFDSIGVPLTVIFPADNPTKPLILREKYSQSELLKTLEEATKSQKTAMSQTSANE